jgi:ribonuclease Z
VKVPGGKTISPHQVVGASRPGRKIVYSGDTRPSDRLQRLAQNADLLIHEATLSDELLERAQEDGHSTPSQAAETAKKARVKRLVLTHVSSRYKNTEELLQQAKKVFSNVEVATDFMKLELPLLE